MPQVQANQSDRLTSDAEPLPSVGRPESASSHRRYLWLLATATLVTGVAWGLVVPPFEAADESVFYQDLMNYAHGRAGSGRPLYAAIMKPALVLAGEPDRPFQARYNPAFRFISNERGRVNMFMHGRMEGTPRGDVNRMYLLRFLTLCLWLASLVLIFETARLFFGRSDLAMLTAALCLCLPELSFFSSKIHPESTSTLLASAAYFAFAARACGRLGRVPVWIVGLAVLGLAPFSDRQAFFLMLLVPVGLVGTETTRRNAAIAAAVLLSAGLVLLSLPQLADMRSDVSMWISPFMPNYRFGWWTPDMSQHLAFEFAPKLFLGFFGWLGQPSILLPPTVYAAMAVAIGLGLAGLALPSGRKTATLAQRRIGWIFLAGVLLTLAPILYTNILIDRTSTGRWLLPMLAPFMIGLVWGFRSFVAPSRRRPYLVALVLMAASAALAAGWAGGIGDAIRAGIHAHHYGDQEHLITTITDTVVALAAVGGIIALAAFAFRGIPTTLESRAPITLAAGVWVLNLLLLFSFVAPLYRPLDAAGLADAVRAEAAQGEYEKASTLYRLALATYPESAELRSVAVETPLLSLSGGDDQMLAALQTRIGRGETLQTRAELMALARIVRIKGRPAREALRQVLDRAPKTPEVREPLALIRAEVDGRMGDGTAGADVIRTAGGVFAPLEMRDQGRLEGFTLNPVPTGREVIVYFTPRRDWAGRRLWVHAYPAGSEDYITLDPVLPPFAGWKTGELAWEVFQLPANTQYTLYVGVEVDHNLGPPYPLGAIGP